jgi:uncharacterized protein HemX
MTHPWDELWPVPEAPSDFALRVLVASERGRGQSQPVAAEEVELAFNSSAQTQPVWSRASTWLGVVLAACVVLAIGGGVSFHEHQNEAAKRAAILEAQRKETEERLRRLQADFEAATRKEQELLASLADAKDEATRATLRAELEAQKKATARPAAGGPVRVRSATRSCSPGDPLCD